MESKSIITIVEYGEICLNLAKVLDEREVTRNALAKATNTRFEVIDKWCKNEVEKLDLDVLARICYALDCLPTDILTYQKPNSDK